MLIHLVDDDLTVLDAARFLLEQAGYQVQTWSNSQAFVNKAPLFEPGVVLLDMKMPLLDGHCIQPLKMRNIKRDRDFVVINGNKLFKTR